MKTPIGATMYNFVGRPIGRSIWLYILGSNLFYNLRLFSLTG